MLGPRVLGTCVHVSKSKGQFIPQNKSAYYPSVIRLRPYKSSKLVEWPKKDVNNL